MLQDGGWRVRFPMSLDFLSPCIYSFLPHYGPGDDSASNRNEYEESYLRGEGKARPARKVNNLTAICETIA
jgi:hypothetical protein